jgi:hypothetical protein
MLKDIVGLFNGYKTKRCFPNILILFTHVNKVEQYKKGNLH